MHLDSHKTNQSTTRVAQLLRDMRTHHRLATSNWDSVIRQARSAGLLGRLATELVDAGLIDDVPTRPRHHLEAERHLAQRHDRDVRWEVRCIGRALGRVGVPIVLLKGAAYVLGDLPPARGRTFSDIDIMVPFESLAKVEAALKEAGWCTAELTPYDDRYYRRWMHQLPPMHHSSRGIVVDVHHTIVARTTRLGVQPDRLFAAAVDIENDNIFKILSPADMVLHSATHLFNGGDFDRSLRDLDDVNLLLRHFGSDERFWSALLERAAEFDLNRPLYYALRYAPLLFGSPIPEAVTRSMLHVAPNAVQRGVMDRLLERALTPPHRSSRNGFSRAAIWLLYVRAHHLLMPAHILVPHLVRKAITAKQSTTP